MSDHLIACQKCGAQAGEADPYYDGKPILMAVWEEVIREDGFIFVHHVCSVCDEGLRSLALSRPSLEEVLVPLRRAAEADQLETLHWLRSKFPDA